MGQNPSVVSVQSPKGGIYVRARRNSVTKGVSLVDQHPQRFPEPGAPEGFPFENLVFEGGGAKGLIHVGALYALEQRGILKHIKRVAGTSVGSWLATVVAIGLPPQTVDEFFESIDMAHLLKDKCPNWMFLGDIQRLQNEYGIHAGVRLYDWWGEVLQEFTGDADITFAKIYERYGRELAITGTNLCTQKAEHFHIKTSPDFPVRRAIRISSSYPLFLSAWPETDPMGFVDHYIDGGVTLNYPIDAFDGWWLSMDPSDNVFERLLAYQCSDDDEGEDCEEEEWHGVQAYGDRFSMINLATLGFKLGDDTFIERWLPQFQKIFPSMVYSDEPLPDTEAAKVCKDVESLHTRVAQAKMGSTKFIELLRMMSRCDVTSYGTVTVAELLELNAHRLQECFGGRAADIVSEMDLLGRGEISFMDLAVFMETHGYDVHSQMHGVKRQDISTLGQFITSLLDALSSESGNSMIQNRSQLMRSVVLNTRYIETLEFALHPDDRSWMMRQGERQTSQWLDAFSSDAAHLDEDDFVAIVSSRRTSPRRLHTQVLDCIASDDGRDPCDDHGSDCHTDLRSESCNGSEMQDTSKINAASLKINASAIMRGYKRQPLLPVAMLGVEGKFQTWWKGGACRPEALPIGAVIAAVCVTCIGVTAVMFQEQQGDPRASDGTDDVVCRPAAGGVVGVWSLVWGSEAPWARIPLVLTASLPALVLLRKCVFPWFARRFCRHLSANGPDKVASYMLELYGLSTVFAVMTANGLWALLYVHPSDVTNVEDCDLAFGLQSVLVYVPSLYILKLACGIQARLDAMLHHWIIIIMSLWSVAVVNLVQYDMHVVRMCFAASLYLFTEYGVLIGILMYHLQVLLHVPSYHLVTPLCYICCRLAVAILSIWSWWAARASIFQGRVHNSAVTYGLWLTIPLVNLVMLALQCATVSRLFKVHLNAKRRLALHLEVSASSEAASTEDGIEEAEVRQLLAEVFETIDFDQLGYIEPESWRQYVKGLALEVPAPAKFLDDSFDDLRRSPAGAVDVQAFCSCLSPYVIHSTDMRFVLTGLLLKWASESCGSRLDHIRAENKFELEAHVTEMVRRDFMAGCDSDRHRLKAAVEALWPSFFGDTVVDSRSPTSPKVTSAPLLYTSSLAKPANQSFGVDPSEAPTLLRSSFPEPRRSSYEDSDACVGGSSPSSSR